eukprot:8550778-Lingulodinium_polyedra.AAC.1
MARSMDSAHLTWLSGPGSWVPRRTCTRCESVPCTSMTHRAITLTDTSLRSGSTEPLTSG